jgi:hypothetical protein
VISDRDGVVPHAIKPVNNILAAVTPGRTWSRTDAQMDSTTCEEEVLCDLTARLTTADDKHGTRWKGVRMSVIACINLDDFTGKAWSIDMTAGDVITTRCNHNVVRKYFAFRSKQPVTVAVVHETLNCHAFSQIRADKRCKTLQIRNDLRFDHKPIGIRAVVREIG